jgi:hypothetical protein
VIGDQTSSISEQLAGDGGGSGRASML